MISLVITLMLICALMVGSRQRVARVCFFLLFLTGVTFFFVPACYLHYVPDSSLHYIVLFREHLTASLQIASLFYAVSTFVAFLIFRLCRPISTFAGKLGRTSLSVPLIFLVVSIVANLYLIRHGMFLLEGADQVRAQAPGYIRFLSNVHLLAFYLVLARYVCDRMHVVAMSRNVRSLRILDASILFYSLALPVFQARRAGVVLPIILLMVVAYAYRRIRFRTVLLGGLIVVLLFSLVTAVRTRISRVMNWTSFAPSSHHSRGIEAVLSADPIQHVIGG